MGRSSLDWSTESTPPATRTSSASRGPSVAGPTPPATRTSSASRGPSAAGSTPPATRTSSASRGPLAKVDLQYLLQGPQVRLEDPQQKSIYNTCYKDLKCV